MDNFVITISRGFGCGGRNVGRAIAKELGIKSYGHEIITIASQESGISEELFAQADEKIKGRAKLTAGGLPKFTGKIIGPNESGFTSDANIFNYEAKIIKDLADKESCIIIGRAADYVLKDYPRVFSVSLISEIEDRIKKVKGYMPVDDVEAAKEIKNRDKKRADFYLYYTGRHWDDALNYDLTINVSKMTEEQVVQLILESAKIKFGIDSLK